MAKAVGTPQNSYCFLAKVNAPLLDSTSSSKPCGGESLLLLAGLILTGKRDTDRQLAGVDSRLGPSSSAWRVSRAFWRGWACRAVLARLPATSLKRPEFWGAAGRSRPTKAALRASWLLTIHGTRPGSADFRRYRPRAPYPHLEASGANLGLFQGMRVAVPARHTYEEPIKRLSSMGGEHSCSIFRNWVGVGRDSARVRYGIGASRN